MGREKMPCPACGKMEPIHYGRNGLITFRRHVAKGEAKRKCGCKYPTLWAAWVERVRSWGLPDPR